MKTTLKSTLKALLTLTFILTLLLNGTAFAQSAFDQTAAEKACRSRTSAAGFPGCRSRTVTAAAAQCATDRAGRGVDGAHGDHCF